MSKKFKIQFEMPEQRVVDLLTSACEGGSNYWAQNIDPLGKSKDAYRAMLKGFTIEDHTRPRVPRYTVTPTKIKRALQLFPILQPKHFAEWVAENDDAETGDQFLQICVFGKAIYG